MFDWYRVVYQMEWAPTNSKERLQCGFTAKIHGYLIQILANSSEKWIARIRMGLLSLSYVLQSFQLFCLWFHSIRCKSISSERNKIRLYHGTPWPIIGCRVYAPPKFRFETESFNARISSMRQLLLRCFNVSEVFICFEWVPSPSPSPPPPLPPPSSSTDNTNIHTKWNTIEKVFFLSASLLPRSFTSCHLNSKAYDAVQNDKTSAHKPALAKFVLDTVTDRENERSKVKCEQVFCNFSLKMPYYGQSSLLHPPSLHRRHRRCEKFCRLIIGLLLFARWQVNYSRSNWAIKWAQATANSNEHKLIANFSNEFSVAIPVAESLYSLLRCVSEKIIGSQKGWRANCKMCGTCGRCLSILFVRKILCVRTNRIPNFDSMILILHCSQAVGSRPSRVHIIMTTTRIETDIQMANSNAKATDGINSNFDSKWKRQLSNSIITENNKKKYGKTIQRRYTTHATTSSHEVWVCVSVWICMRT